ncbi:hypothetical protein DOTSEDRAFT_57548 [Dothistroma septosporum NZE10]|uniref:Glucose-methanol-choline oxidoreductase N-terminal domain-containing protein n=1 Tax=Dothistroma septosporum (strain NZE10 / CBS 128990) TaxID=675120 RepID=N1PDE9_DOTSN|nr:hypothetical protein DOTSEDRAFT_57548 [Dothistroma septosporum NZE10]
MHPFLDLLAATVLSTALADSADYVIVGGGTAGLTIAARLSENPSITVAVIEAGEDRSEDIEDWNYHTTEQEHANDHVIAHPRGKQLGGSSAINFLWWTHASQQDIDNWGHLGNDNWTWDALQPFYRRSEHYVEPPPTTAEALQTEYIELDSHGRAGAVINGFADIYTPFDEAWPSTYDNLGLGVRSDPRDGLTLGGYTNLINLDPKTRSRSYAATTYLREAGARSNLKVLTGAHAQRILFDTSNDTPQAIGVSYIQNATMKQIKARKEVIVSAGAFGSPQLLELSGIGNATILRQYGIEALVENTHVGENLQDHAYVPLGFEVREPGVFTLDDLANSTLFNRTYEQYVTNRTGWLASDSAMSALLSLEQIRGNDNASFRLEREIDWHCIGHFTPPEPYLEQRNVLCNDIRHGAVVQEFAFPSGINPQSSNDSSTLVFATTPGNFFSMQGVLEHPFSRGSVHIQSSNASVYPRLDPAYLSHELDVKMLAVIALHLQQIARSAPLSDLLIGNGTVFQPGYHELTSENAEAWVIDSLQSEYHPSCTCAMLPKDRGGVVDAKFRVYGVDGLRIVDASIFPLIPRANLQTLVYAVAERVASFIRQDLES